MSGLVGAVDYWCNAFFPDRAARWQAAIDRQELTLKVHRDGDEFCSADQMVERLDESGFATVIVVASEPPPTGPDDPNLFEHVACRANEVADLVEVHPNRFRGVWSIDPTAGTSGVALAAEMIGQPWCVGLHNHTHSWNRRFDHADFEPYYQLCAEHDLPFVMQAGASGGRFPADCGRPEGIDRPAADYPSVRFVLSHTGWPWTTEAIARATSLENVFLGSATWPLRHWTPELREFANSMGRSKMIYGSGFPMTGHRQAARQFADPDLTAGLDSDAIARITSGNAREVFTRLPPLTEPGPTQEN